MNDQQRQFTPPSGGNYGSIREKVEAERKQAIAKQRAEDGEMPPQEEELPASWAIDAAKSMEVGKRIIGSIITEFQADAKNGSLVSLTVRLPEGKSIVVAFNPMEDARFLPGIIDTMEEPARKAL